MEMNDDLFGKAVKAYYRFCNRNGYVHQEPSKSLSETDKRFICLNNINGPLAWFEIETGRIYEDDPSKE